MSAEVLLALADAPFVINEVGVEEGLEVNVLEEDGLEPIVRDGVGEAVGDANNELVEVLDGETPRVIDEVGVAVGVEVSVVLISDMAGLKLPVPVTVGVPEGVSEPLSKLEPMEGVPVPLIVTLPVILAVPLPLLEAVGVGVPVEEEEGKGEGVIAGVTLDVGVQV